MVILIRMPDGQVSFAVLWLFNKA